MRIEKITMHKQSWQYHIDDYQDIWDYEFVIVDRISEFLNVNYRESDEASIKLNKRIVE